ncbi:MAG: DUF2865 domain-containing protein [Hyphomicrobiales bacterium]|nr:DUF2865 domain-containing protein [Hyphomicrobiales bacterium]
MRVPVLAGTAMIALAGAVLATAQSAQAQGMQAPAAQTAPTSGVQLAGLFDWLKGKPKAPPRAPEPQQAPEPQLTPPPRSAPGQATAPRRRAAPPTGGGTYRTLCVRTCDGFYFPISFKATRSKFKADAAACQSRCSEAKAQLFVYRNPGGSVNGAVDLAGNRYADLENAFLYRKELVQGCGCEPAPWADTGGDAQ